MLPHGNVEKAKEAFWQFKADGLELIATAALLDPSATANLIATHINYKVVSRSGSKEVAKDCQALLHAVADVQQCVDNFLVEMGRERAAALDAEDERAAEEERAGGVLATGEEVILIGAETGEDEGQQGMVLSSGSNGVVVRLDSGRKVTVPRINLKRVPPQPRNADNSSDTTTASEEQEKEPQHEATVRGAPEAPSVKSPSPAPGPVLLSKIPDLSPALADPERTQWDPKFSHPYVGAMDGGGDEIFCRACCRWIRTRKYAHEPFLRHVDVVHKKPPQGWKGPVPEDGDMPNHTKGNE